MSKKKPGAPSATIALNKKAKHEYHIEERFEAGLALLGWEVKSIRAGKAQLTDAYVLLKDGGLAAGISHHSAHCRLNPRYRGPDPNP